jgi:hypothetical protein
MATKRVIIEFTAVVGLKSKKGKLKLRPNINMELSKALKHVRLSSQREGPYIVSKIIDKYKIILKSRAANSGRGPDISMDNLKWNITN